MFTRIDDTVSTEIFRRERSVPGDGTYLKELFGDKFRYQGDWIEIRIAEAVEAESEAKKRNIAPDQPSLEMKQKSKKK